VALGGSYTQTVERIKDKITVSDIFTSNNVFMTSLKDEFDSYMRVHPKSNMSYDTYQKAALNSRAFGYESIKDGQQKQEFWRNIALAAFTIGATILCPPAGIALAASIAVMELSSSATGKDWGTGRKLDTNERWLRGAFAIVDILPAAKGMVAFGDVTTGLKAGATTVKSGLKIGLEEGGSRLKQIDNLLTERAQNAKRLSVEKLENLSLNIARKIDTTHTNIKISAENLHPNLQPAGLWDASLENKQGFEK
jgi:hypothetical protein